MCIFGETEAHERTAMKQYVSERNFQTVREDTKESLSLRFLSVDTFIDKADEVTPFLPSHSPELAGERHVLPQLLLRPSLRPLAGARHALCTVSPRIDHFYHLPLLYNILTNNHLITSSDYFLDLFFRVKVSNVF